jgi:probable rRNA maturation factor
MLEYPAPADFDFLENADDSASADDSFNPDTGELMLGDIIISVDHVMAQAEQYGHSIQREYAFLIAHSMLHLMGFDHMTPEEAQVMETEQEKILTPLGYIRE